ncbi:NAD-dependent epimerase/dehydratase family protein [Photobacterium nomapromontoriensis]|uniref:NAD-dependent epimerase/dehydratase family protein n=1 Tax=Photobacterium nomapromontoriensis TaxID=2910237 RepID=UPI003D0A67A8
MAISMKVSICGCGWLGKPLAVHLAQQGMAVWGSRQDPLSANLLFADGIEGVALSLPTDLTAGPLGSRLMQFFDTDVLVINVPPGRKEDADSTLINNVMLLARRARQNGCRRLIFISTTAVYGNVTGTVTEMTTPMPNTASGKAHYQLEQQLQAEWGDDAVILRLAGLIGPGRNPVKFLSGREGIANGLDRVNLIHQYDCIAAVSRIIACWPGGAVLHLSAPEHPTREKYYCHMANLLELPAPHFASSGDRNAKVVDATYTCQLLSLTLRYPLLMPLIPEL